MNSPYRRILDCMSPVSSSTRENQDLCARGRVLITRPSFDCFILRRWGHGCASDESWGTDAAISSAVNSYDGRSREIPRCVWFQKLTVWKHARSKLETNHRGSKKENSDHGFVTALRVCASQLIKVTNIWEDRTRRCARFTSRRA